MPNDYGTLVEMQESLRDIRERIHELIAEAASDPRALSDLRDLRDQEAELVSAIARDVWSVR